MACVTTSTGPATSRPPSSGAGLTMAASSLKWKTGGFFMRVLARCTYQVTKPSITTMSPKKVSMTR
jgi:hypothetical protein